MVPSELLYLSEHPMAIHDRVGSPFSSGSGQSAVSPRPRLVPSALIFLKLMDVDLSWKRFTERNYNIFLFKDKFQEQHKHTPENSGSDYTIWEKALCPAYCFDTENYPWFTILSCLKFYFSICMGFFPSSKKMATHEELESVRWRIHLSRIITGLSKLDQSEGIVLL